MPAWHYFCIVRLTDGWHLYEWWHTGDSEGGSGEFSLNVAGGWGVGSRDFSLGAHLSYSDVLGEWWC